MAELYDASDEVGEKVTCPTCDGSGMNVYPSIEAQGLVAVPCEDCAGEKVAASTLALVAALQADGWAPWQSQTDGTWTWMKDGGYWCRPMTPDEMAALGVTVAEVGA